MQIDQAEPIIGVNGADPHFDDVADDTSANDRKYLISYTVLLASLVMGVLGNILFFGQSPGINVPLFVLAYIVIAFGLIRLLKVEIYPTNLSLLVPALIFAGITSIVASWTLNIVNAALVLGALLFGLRFSGVPRFLGGSLSAFFETAMDMIFVSWLRDPLSTLIQSYGFMKHNNIGQGRFAHFRTTYLSAIARGILLTFPVVLIFGLLLSSADAIFADIMQDALIWLDPKTPWSTVMQLVTIGVFAWFSMVGFRLMLTAPLGVENTERAKRKPILRLSMIESGMMLGAVNGLFIVFILIQARYLFGGEANINAQGLTYAEYARRGFQELLAVSCMTTLLTLWLDHATMRDRDHDRLFRWMVTAMIGLTALLLIAAFYRLYLYQDAYGYTRIRVMSGAFMLWLAVLFGFLLWDIWRVGENSGNRVFWIGCVIGLFGFVLTLNLINMDRFIAAQNIARWEHGESLDVLYLTGLSEDAIPVIAPLLDSEDLTDGQRDILLTRLGGRLYSLDNWREGGGLFGYHLGLERAWNALDDHRETLAPYIRFVPTFLYGREPYD